MHTQCEFGLQQLRVPVLLWRALRGLQLQQLQTEPRHATGGLRNLQQWPNLLGSEKQARLMTSIDMFLLEHTHYIQWNCK